MRRASRQRCRRSCRSLRCRPTRAHAGERPSPGCRGSIAATAPGVRPRRRGASVSPRCASRRALIVDDHGHPSRRAEPDRAAVCRVWFAGTFVGDGEDRPSPGRDLVGRSTPDQPSGDVALPQVSISSPSFVDSAATPAVTDVMLFVMVCITRQRLIRLVLADAGSPAAGGDATPCTDRSGKSSSEPTPNCAFVTDVWMSGMTVFVQRVLEVPDLAGHRRGHVHEEEHVESRAPAVENASGLL